MLSIEGGNASLAVGALVVLGVVGGLFLRSVRFPAITGYIVIGMLLGPSVLNVLTDELADGLSRVVTPIALGIIAYLIGGSLPLSALRGLKRNVVFITMCEGALACLFVALLVTFVAPLVLPDTGLSFESYLSMGIIIGAISLATAPAATLAIIRESNAQGPLTTTLLGVVALDDVLAVTAFAFALGVVSVISGGAEAAAPGMLFLVEVGRIVLSVVAGVLAGLLLTRLTRYAKTRQDLLVMVLGAVILSAGLSEYLGLFPIMVNIALGFVVVNRQAPGQDHVGIVHDIEGVVFVLFFTLAGTHLDLGIVESAGVLAGLIVLGRCAGKFLGASLGATLSGAPAVVRKYLGLTLLPKAGVTVGLALLVLDKPELQAMSGLLVSGVLASTLINELLTPPLAKFALMRAGEAGRTPVGVPDLEAGMRASPD